MSVYNYSAKVIPLITKYLGKLLPSRVDLLPSVSTMLNDAIKEIMDKSIKTEKRFGNVISQSIAMEYVNDGSYNKRLAETLNYKANAFLKQNSISPIYENELSVVLNQALRNPKTLMLKDVLKILSKAPAAPIDTPIKKTTEKDSASSKLKQIKDSGFKYAGGEILSNWNKALSSNTFDKLSGFKELITFKDNILKHHPNNDEKEIKLNFLTKVIKGISIKEQSGNVDHTPKMPASHSIERPPEKHNYLTKAKEMTLSRFCLEFQPSQVTRDTLKGFLEETNLSPDAVQKLFNKVMPTAIEDKEVPRKYSDKLKNIIQAVVEDVTNSTIKVKGRF